MANLDVDLTNLEKSLNNNKPDLLILTHVNSVSGHILDVAAISSLAKKICPNVHVHVDAAQGFTKIPLDLSGGYIDSVSISAHKIGGPKGISGLYIKAGVNVDPLLLGGGHECGMRSSTPATALIEAFALAARLMCSSQQKHLSHTASLVDLLKAKLIEMGCDVKMPFVNLANQSPYIVSLFVPPLAGDVLMRNLEQEDVMISTRSACSSKNNNTPEFEVLNINPEWMSASLRVSFSARTTAGDVVRFCELFADVLSMLFQLQDR
jgi:cysteine desulfurase